jgi:hypothetical protein
VRSLGQPSSSSPARVQPEVGRGVRRRRLHCLLCSRWCSLGPGSEALTKSFRSRSQTAPSATVPLPRHLSRSRRPFRRRSYRRAAASCSRCAQRSKVQEIKIRLRASKRWQGRLRRHAQSRQLCTEAAMARAGPGPSRCWRWQQRTQDVDALQVDADHSQDAGPSLSPLGLLLLVLRHLRQSQL